MPIAPSNFEFTGLKWRFIGDTEFTFLRDTRLCMGTSKSPWIFQKLSDAVCKIMRFNGYICIVYLDDYYVCAKSESECREAYDFLWSLLTDLGFTINVKKSIPPCQCLIFLGIEIDTRSRTMSIPSTKVADIQNELDKWINTKKASKRAIQRLLGKMNWAAKCVKAARPYMRRLIELTKGKRARNQRFRLTAEARADIVWWRNFMVQFNGVSFWYPENAQPNYVAVTDASNEGGAAAASGGDFSYLNWEIDVPSIRQESINVKEIHAILLALERWGHCWKDSLVHVYTDSNVALFSIRKGSIDNAKGMSLMRRIHMILAVYNIKLDLKRISTKDNCFADALSRLDNPEYALKAFEMLCDPMLHSCRVVCDARKHISDETMLHLLQEWQRKSTHSI